MLVFPMKNRVNYVSELSLSEYLSRIHQVNKVLDLMIDGEQGCWIFSADEMIFKTEDLSGKHIYRMIV